MRLSDLQSKNVVSMLDGKNIGTIIDVDFNRDNGSINYLVVDPLKGSFRVFNREEEKKINWVEINKIGEDVILVETKY